MSTTPKRFNLAEGFRQSFEILPALTDSLRNDVYFIRHDVYARELGFEPVREDQRETDAYDRRSLHCLLRTANEPRRLVGCARLVLADPAAPEALLPLEIYCRETLDRSVIDPSQLPRERMAEVSRLAVMADFRRRKGEQGREVSIQDGDFGDAQQSRFPYIPVSLYIGAVALAQRHGIEYLLTLTEPRLAQHFAKLGVNIVPIGAPVEHRGMRVPSLMRVSDIVSGLRLFVRPLWRTINEQIAAAYGDAPVKPAP
ncbi:MAG TPA: PEP-CTERM/exosortase system-associated acyltransferase [Burkholderiaceae bacterium]|nr:PEP-CTERM/exosortase system-associated acyltransferase [Burkholderiaceae bacterium]